MLILSIKSFIHKIKEIGVFISSYFGLYEPIKIVILNDAYVENLFLFSIYFTSRFDLSFYSGIESKLHRFAQSVIRTNNGNDSIP